MDDLGRFHDRGRGAAGELLNIESRMEKLNVTDGLLYATIMFAGSSVAGWALLLWEAKPITARQKVGGVLLSGFSGVISSLLLYDYLKESPSLLAGVSLLAGIGGASTIEWLLMALRRGLERRLKINTDKTESKN